MPSNERSSAVWLDEHTERINQRPGIGDRRRFVAVDALLTDEVIDQVCRAQTGLALLGNQDIRFVLETAIAAALPGEHADG